MSKNISILLITLLVLLPLQIVVLGHLALFNIGFCFVYLLFLLLLPIEISPVKILFGALLLGLVVDICGGTPGIHAASCVLLMFLRPFWLNSITPRKDFGTNTLLCIANYSLSWFLLYAGPLVLIHSLAFFFLEAAGSGLFWTTLSKVVLTSFLTLVFMVSLQYLFYPKSKV